MPRKCTDSLFSQDLPHNKVAIEKPLMHIVDFKKSGNISLIACGYYLSTCTFLTYYLNTSHICGLAHEFYIWD